MLVKNHLLLLIVGMIFVIMLLTFKVFNVVMPMAPVIRMPMLDEITKVEVTKGNIFIEYEDVKSISSILKFINDSGATRFSALTDIPAYDYYQVDLLMISGVETVYIYVKNNKMYVYLPYVGVYRINEEMLFYLTESI